jgi:hypothetical protein
MTLTIRERNGQRLGTVQNPLHLPVVPRQTLSITLGYDGEAPTAVWALTVTRRMELRVERRSTDPLANAVGVTVMDPISRQQMGRLVCNADGTGEMALLPPGRYLMIASLGLLEQVSVDLVVQLVPERMPISGAALCTGGGVLSRTGNLQGVAESFSTALLEPDSLLDGVAASSNPALLTRAPMELLEPGMAGVSATSFSGGAEVAEFFWVDRRGRRMGADIRITPLTYNQQIWRNADYHLLLRVKDAGGDPVDLSDLTVTVAVHDGRRLVRYALLDVDPAGLTEGLIDAWLDWQVTATLPSQVWMDVLLENGAGQGQYPLEAIWIVESGYTT